MSEVVLPEDRAARKAIPMVRGLVDYFPAALAEVARVSQVANEQHNPGEEMHWAWGKSNDHADCIVRHLVDRGTLDNDGLRHSAKVAWRALALLQEELVAEGAPLPRAARVEEATPAPAEKTWHCRGCASTTFYNGREWDEYCDTPGCYGGMVLE